MPENNERSAEYWRGVLDTAKQAGYSKLAIYGYTALLADAEAREAGEMQALPLAELQRKHGELACELLSAAEVVEACEKALWCWRTHVTTPTGPTASYGAILESLAVAKMETDNAIDLCARWKEANGGPA